jgi:predicted transcriptional regulator
MEEAGAVNEPNFQAMTKEQIVAWFRSACTLAPIMATMTPSTEPPAAARPETPMMLISIRLPVDLVTDLDEIGRRHGTRRSETIRTALTEYVREQTDSVESDEGEHALDVLRRIVAQHRSSQIDAA